MSEATARPARWRVFAPDTAGAIYGTIVAMAVIAGTAADPGHGKALTLTVATLAVFWLAHVYAQTLSHHLKGAKRLEWPVLVLGELHVLQGRTAVRLALWIGVAELVTWGILYARRQRWSWPSSITAGAVNGLLGLAIVLLEVVVH
jgi:hypothetical protein